MWARVSSSHRSQYWIGNDSKERMRYLRAFRSAAILRFASSSDASGYTMLWKRSDFPSGLHLGAYAPVESEVMRSASPPPMRRTQICVASSASRFAENAIADASGAHVTPLSLPRVNVRRFGAADPSAGTIQRSD